MTSMTSTIIRSPYPEVTIPEVSLPEFVFADAASRAAKPALIDGPNGHTITYGQLVDQARLVPAAWPPDRASPMTYIAPVVGILAGQPTAQEAWFVNKDLRRAFAFVAIGDMGGAHSEVSRYGLAVFDEALPLRYDSNYLLVDELPDAVSADDLAAEARRLDRPAIMVRDQRTGARLVPGFEQLGWQLHRGLVMAHRRKPERTADTGLVQEVDEAVLRPARRTQLAGEPWATPALVEQLLAAKLAIARVVVARFFAVLEDGQVVSYVDLYCDGCTAQIEDLATLEQHRGRGYASALVLRALQEARRAGCDLVFLVADAQDWPKALYRRLGFDELGCYVKFIRPD